MRTDPETTNVLPARAGSDLALRVVSALVMVPVAIGAAVLGGWPFLVFWLIAALLVLWEWTGLVAPGQLASIVSLSGLCLAGAALALALGHAAIALVALAIGLLAAAFLASADRRLWAGAGAVYAAAIVMAPVLLRADPAFGLAAILLLFAVVWASDICAYFGGRLIGGPKLWARVSPKKTWSGAVVGTLCAIAAALAVAAWARLAAFGAIAGLAFILSVASAAGDLFESAIKRRFAAKDASQLIPGHGGLMDRLDGFVAAALLAAAVGVARGGLEAASRGLLIW